MKGRCAGERSPGFLYNTAVLTELTPVEWDRESVRLLDQSRLPWEETFLELRTAEEVGRAIREMRVRGAPAIGVTAAYGMALAAVGLEAADRESDLAILREAARELAAARPTAVNLKWAVDRIMRVAEQAAQDADLRAVLLAEARRIHHETRESDLRLSEFGASLIPPGSSVLTHCNTGTLATGGYGTALGVIRRGWEEGRIKQALATETRPWLQGARLTTWELTRLGIPVTLIVDSAAGYLMDRGMVQCVITGADRVAANGDTANKIGTLSLAVLAHQYGIPFYVAAPVSTIDLSIASGAEIPIEERPESEVTGYGTTPTAPADTHAWNPAFDVTHSRYIAAIITDCGIARAPYEESLRRLVSGG